MSWRGHLSALIGWLADIRVPRPLRPLVYGLFVRFSGADLGEAQLARDDYPSVTALFVRRLRPGARPICAAPQLPCPADGRLQGAALVGPSGNIEAKGQRFSLDQLLGPARSWLGPGDCLALTVYLSPKDYHRVHCPLQARLLAAYHLGGERYSVSPQSVLRRPSIHAENERVALILEGPAGRFALVLVGALNVGRMRVVGLANGHQGPLARPLEFERGGELGRFELGSTAILLWPQGNPAGPIEPLPGLTPGDPLRMGAAWARFASPPAQFGD
jgi:phosphatidylserine decarboxylase